VFVGNYGTRKMSDLGLSPEELAARRPGIVSPCVEATSTIRKAWQRHSRVDVASKKAARQHLPRRVDACRRAHIGPRRIAAPHAHQRDAVQGIVGCAVSEGLRGWIATDSRRGDRRRAKVQGLPF
jgi:hypothetical protein